MFIDSLPRILFTIDLTSNRRFSRQTILSNDSLLLSTLFASAKYLFIPRKTSATTRTWIKLWRRLNDDWKKKNDNAFDFGLLVLLRNNKSRLILQATLVMEDSQILLMIWIRRKVCGAKWKYYFAPQSNPSGIFVKSCVQGISPCTSFPNHSLCHLEKHFCVNDIKGKIVIIEFIFLNPPEHLRTPDYYISKLFCRNINSFFCVA